MDRSGRSFGAKVIGADPVADVALLKMTGHQGVRPPEMTLSPPAGGERSLAIGYPGGSLQPVTSEGSFLSERHAVRSDTVYSGRSQRPAMRQLAVEMKMVPGNSGSPLLDGTGKVYGLVTEGSLDVTTAHAAPISKVLDLLKKQPI